MFLFIHGAEPLFPSREHEQKHALFTFNYVLAFGSTVGVCNLLYRFDAMEKSFCMTAIRGDVQRSFLFSKELFCYLAKHEQRIQLL